MILSVNKNYILLLVCIKLNNVQDWNWPDGHFF